MSATPLPGLLGAVAPVLENYGYLAVAGLILVENFGVPAPGETILVAASVYAGTGRLNIVAVGAIAVLAAVVGNCIGYTIGYFGGHALVLRYGRYVFLTAARLERAETYFARHGGKMITIARFLEGLRQANGIIAGISGMPWRIFLAYNALGAALWAGLWSSLGYLAGHHIGVIYQQITQYSLYVLAGLGVAVLALVARHLVRRRAAKKTPTATQQRPPAAGESRGDAPSQPAPHRPPPPGPDKSPAESDPDPS